MGCNNSTQEIYFDNNATTKPLPEVREEMLKVLGDCFGNPSSANAAGERARKFLNRSRTSVSEILGCNSNQIIFTSSGTESNNMAFYSCTLNKEDKCKIITTNVEHSSIKKMCSHLKLNGVDITTLEVNNKGLIDLNYLEELLKDGVDLVSIQWVNNETGVIQDIARISELCSEKGVLLHTDAAQAVGKIRINLSNLPIDFLSFTGHKLNGPQGCGVLYAKDKFFINPILFGGFQEDGFRPGTENLPGIVGLGKACEIRHKNLDKIIDNLKNLRDKFESMLLDFIPDTRINGEKHNRVCNTTNIRFNNFDGRELISLIDNEGVRCSQSSACTNFEVSPSYVLLAMNLTEKEAYSSIRFSFGVDNNFDEIKRAVEIIRDNCNKLTPA
ncbi:MAG: aminotransferase class V-fold PLP-dependent enzyme [Candidatus Dadabacteria bacterium]|nr:aminotransferase class V-fold PLP-dependent enzyme [Candidatus Dadabacteria bacterium]NIQ17121.1 aminotransferase class V-fold PLP-dependent enzyme [Candidatus Dadabacteria bacterium]